MIENWIKWFMVGVSVVAIVLGVSVIVWDYLGGPSEKTATTAPPETAVTPITTTEPYDEICKDVKVKYQFLNDYRTLLFTITNNCSDDILFKPGFYRVSGFNTVTGERVKGHGEYMNDFVVYSGRTQTVNMKVYKDNIYDAFVYVDFTYHYDKASE